MFRCLGLAVAFAVTVPACGSTPKPVKKVHKEPKKDSKAMVADAREDAKSGEYDAADKKYAQAYQDSQDFDVLEEWVDFLIHNGRAQKGVDAAKTYYDAHMTEAKGYALYADALLAAEDGPKALEVAQGMIDLDDKNAAGHEKKGRALILLGKEEGLEELRKAVHLDPDNATYNVSLGKALFQLGKVDEAALAFRAAVKAEPENADAHVYLGMALRGQSEYDEAKVHLTKAIDIDPHNGRAYFELGLIAGLQNKADEAEQALAKAVKMSPNDSQFWYAYGEVFRSTDRLDEALSAYRKAVELDPPYPKAQQKLGLLLVERKQYDEAEVVLTQAIRRDKNIAVNYLNLGTVYAAKKKNQLAIENFEKFLSLASKSDPDRARAKDAINELKRKH
ncbi:MAG: tetratricopeptide repeat protein [Deltaproteobacteria bacterium]|nr:tetratricopeptide repeat protein [Deltaproteobacteria bacterium]